MAGGRAFSSYNEQPEAFVTLDVIFAKGKLSVRMKGESPEIAAGESWS